jgi:hypothetical protein
MSTSIELAFVVFGFFALCWAIMSPNPGIGTVRPPAGSACWRCSLVCCCIQKIGRDAMTAKANDVRNCNAIAVERRLEREVEARERLDGGELGHPQCNFTRRFSRSVSSSANRVSMTSSGTGFAALELAHGLVQDLQSSGHLQANQGFADAVEYGRYDLDGRGHGWSPWQARRWPTAW